jgi:RNA-directed DNA polymerase
MTRGAPVNSGASSLMDLIRERVARTQAKYHRWAKADRELRFGDLFNLVSDLGYLQVAWEHVARNKGARTAGIDGVTVRQIEQRGEAGAFLSRIAASLKDGTYRPSPVRRVMIPKPGGKSRPLGIPTATA